VPPVLRVAGFRFFFYSGDGGEPPHVHVETSDGTAKFWLDPVRISVSAGLSRPIVGRMQRLVECHRLSLLRSWHDFFRT
jgi:hypothetical protein